MKEPAMAALGANTVAFIGLGNMGKPMAQALVRAGYKVNGWTRTQPESAVEGVELKKSLDEAVLDADIIFVMVFDAAAVEDLFFVQGGVHACKPGICIVDMGTTGPKAAVEHGRLFAKFGIDYLDAPVSGGVGGAIRADLAIFVGGEPNVFARYEPALTAMGNPRYLGVTGAGQTAKLANQIIVALYIAAVAEGLRFGESNGLDAGSFLGAVEGGFADSRVLREHGARMATSSFTAGGASKLHLKDLRLADDLMTDLKLPHMAEALSRFQSLVERGFGEADHSAYYLTYDLAF